MLAHVLAAALASTEPQLTLGRHGAVISQYTVAGGVERYATGETPARLSGAPAEYDETVVFGGIKNAARLRLTPLDGGVGLALTAFTEVQANGRVARDTFSETLLDGYLVLDVVTAEPILVELSISGRAITRHGAEAGLDVRLDGVEIAVVHAGDELPRRVPVRVPAGSHQVWVDVLAKAASPGASASASFEVKATLAAPGKAPAPEPEPACVARAVRFPSERPLGDSLQVTHVWPNDPGFTAVQPASPVFLVRVDGRVLPSEIIRELAVSDATWASWRRPLMKVLGCFIEGDRYTTVVMRPVEPPGRYGQGVQWYLRSADLREPIGAQRFRVANEARGEAHGAGGMAMTPDPRWPEGRVFKPDAVDVGLDETGYTKERIAAELSNDREALELLSWAGLRLPASAAALAHHASRLAARSRP